MSPSRNDVDLPSPPLSAAPTRPSADADAPSSDARDDERSRDVDDDPERLVTRKEIVSTFPVRSWQLRTWEREGRLPIRRRGPGRTLWYRRGDVEDLSNDTASGAGGSSGGGVARRRPLAETSASEAKAAAAAASAAADEEPLFRAERSVKGELSAKAYAMFKDGASITDVVIALARPKEEIVLLWREYRGVQQLDAFLTAAQKELSTVGVVIDSPGAALAHVKEYAALRRQRDQRAMLATWEARASPPPSPPSPPSPDVDPAARSADDDDDPRQPER